MFISSKFPDNTAVMPGYPENIYFLISFRPQVDELVAIFQISSRAVYSSFRTIFRLLTRLCSRYFGRACSWGYCQFYVKGNLMRHIICEHASCSVFHIPPAALLLFQYELSYSRLSHYYKM